MKITRSSKCYFNKWLTKSKMSELKDILQEYARVCNYFVEKYENEIPQKKKCGYSDNADVNASKVILKRFATGTYGSCYKQEYLEKYTC